MEFEIKRVSDVYGDGKAPCEGAYAKTDGCRTDWYIEIPDLPALMALTKREGDLIVSAKSIWIYDDYME